MPRLPRLPLLSRLPWLPRLSRFSWSLRFPSFPILSSLPRFLSREDWWDCRHCQGSNYCPDCHCCQNCQHCRVLQDCRDGQGCHDWRDWQDCRVCQDCQDCSDCRNWNGQISRNLQNLGLFWKVARIFWEKLQFYSKSVKIFPVECVPNGFVFKNAFDLITEVF